MKLDIILTRMASVLLVVQLLIAKLAVKKLKAAQNVKQVHILLMDNAIPALHLINVSIVKMIKLFALSVPITIIQI